MTARGEPPVHPHRPTLAERCADGGFVLTVSSGTLRTTDAAALRRTLRELADAFDFVHFGDNPRARARVSPWAAAAVALQEGLDPVVHVTCRDRNRLALQADIMGGHLLGVRNLLCLRGDEIALSDQPAARAIRDLDVVDLLGLAHQVTGAGACLLAACDPNAGDGARLFARLAEKVRAGASLLESQPVLEVGRFAVWLRRLREAGIAVPLLVDVFLLTRPEQAAFLRRIPSIHVPDDLENRLTSTGNDPVAAAVETVQSLRVLPGVAGCHLMSLGSDTEAIVEVAARVGSASSTTAPPIPKPPAAADESGR